LYAFPPFNGARHKDYGTKLAGALYGRTVIANGAQRSLSLREIAASPEPALSLVEGTPRKDRLFELCQKVLSYSVLGDHTDRPTKETGG